MVSSAMMPFSSYSQLGAWVKKEANFFRVHLLYFLLVPLVFGAIFFGANGEFHICEYIPSFIISHSLNAMHDIVAFIDSLFLCYSALTVTGLSTVNLSTLTPFQQAILFFLMIIGNVVRLFSSKTLTDTLVANVCPCGRLSWHGSWSSFGNTTS